MLHLSARCYDSLADDIGYNDGHRTVKSSLWLSHQLHMVLDHRHRVADQEPVLQYFPNSGVQSVSNTRQCSQE